MGWSFTEAGDSDIELDWCWFDQNPNREFLMRRLHAEEPIRVEGEGVDVVVVLQRCRGHKALHRTIYAFDGKLERLNLNSDAEIAGGLELIMADPDGPGN